MEHEASLVMNIRSPDDLIFKARFSFSGALRTRKDFECPQSFPQQLIAYRGEWVIIKALRKRSNTMTDANIRINANDANNKLRIH